MGYRLNTYVHAAELDSAGRPTGRAGNFGPNDALPDWALAVITNPDVWAGDKPPARQPVVAAEKPDPAEELERLRAWVAELEKVQAPAGGEPEPGYGEMKLEELRAELKNRELPTSGNKDELVERLFADDTGRKSNSNT